ncbi:aromatic acid exporter family protein [Streptococcus sp. H49]|uniref:aromatic acid exporter family protein n=1 Tax=Streptococcus huangxiaojuni TaxID=3237239 RepID=UPI0034A202C5
MNPFERTIKTVLAAIFAIWLADSLGLPNASSAGIIAILSVLETRKSTLTMAFQRLQSVLLAFLLAVCAYLLLGFHLYALAAYLFIYVFAAYQLGLEAGIAPSTVLVMHLLAEKSLEPDLIFKELSLFVIGAGLAMLLNVYMPTKEKEIQDFYHRVEAQMKEVLYRFEELLLRGSWENKAEHLNELDETLEQALRLVYLEHHNQLFQQTNYHVHYFEMRRQQTKLLRQMADHINHCHLKGRESQQLAQLFQETALQLSEDNTGLGLIEEIEKLLLVFRQAELPQTRQEFERRATLFQLLQDMERFIQIKVDFYREIS